MSSKAGLVHNSYTGWAIESSAGVGFHGNSDGLYANAGIGCIFQSIRFFVNFGESCIFSLVLKNGTITIFTI